MSGSENPAHLSSQGATSTQLAIEDWYNNGPAFLRALDITDKLNDVDNLKEVINGSSEVKRPTTTLVTIPTEEAFIATIMKPSSSWNTLEPAIANAQLLLLSKSSKKIKTDIAVQQPLHLKFRN